jgi:protocatechuate 3,4-dioxygenase beta subunit
MSGKAVSYVALAALAILAGVLLWNNRAPATEETREAAIQQTPAEVAQVSPNAEVITSASECPAELTPSQTEGPYYTAGSPERASLREAGLAGETLVVTGTVFDDNCAPIAGAKLDFWQADAAGVYDNTGFRLRGHQFTDEAGRYRLETVRPAQYGGRTAHIHVKVSPPGGNTLTSQLYFPGEAQNTGDTIFNPGLVVTQTDAGTAEFNFKL